MPGKEAIERVWKKLQAGAAAMKLIDPLEYDDLDGYLAALDEAAKALVDQVAPHAPRVRPDQRDPD